MVSDIVIRIISQLLTLFAVFAIVGQTAAYASLVIAPNHGGYVAPECPGMVDMPSAPKPPPCHGLTLQCLAQLGCMQASALPSPPNGPAKQMAWRFVHYPDGGMVVVGVTVAPEILPPIV